MSATQELSADDYLAAAEKAERETAAMMKRKASEQAPHPVTDSERELILRIVAAGMTAQQDKLIGDLEAQLSPLFAKVAKLETEIEELKKKKKGFFG